MNNVNYVKGLYACVYFVGRSIVGIN